MTRKREKDLAERVVKAAEASLAARNYVSAIDVLTGIGWLTPDAVNRWRQGSTDYLERVVQSNLPRISAAMKVFRSWAAGKGLLARETHYVSRARRRTLRFSRSGDPGIERLYRTHWVSPELSARKRERLVQKDSEASDLAELWPLDGSKQEAQEESPSSA